jgi:hypothetical protein
MIPGTTASQGKLPTTPTIGAATAGNSQATVGFTQSTYAGKTGGGTYRATSSGGQSGTCVSPCSSITVIGLSNGTAYTFTVRLETPYGINSANSASSNSVTPVAPPPSFPPSFPPANPCAGRVCPTNIPPGGEWILTGTYQACIPEICGPFIGNWQSYVTADGCCGFGLFVGCDYSNAPCPF